MTQPVTVRRQRGARSLQIRPGDEALDEGRACRSAQQERAVARDLARALGSACEATPAQSRSETSHLPMQSPPRRPLVTERAPPLRRRAGVRLSRRQGHRLVPRHSLRPHRRSAGRARGAVRVPARHEQSCGPTMRSGGMSEGASAPGAGLASNGVVDRDGDVVWMRARASARARAGRTTRAPLQPLPLARVPPDRRRSRLRRRQSGNHAAEFLPDQRLHLRGRRGIGRAQPPPLERRAGQTGRSGRREPGGRRRRQLTSLSTGCARDRPRRSWGKGRATRQAGYRKGKL